MTLSPLKTRRGATYRNDRLEPEVHLECHKESRGHGGDQMTIYETEAHVTTNRYEESLLLGLTIVTGSVALVVDFAGEAVRHALNGTRPAVLPPRDFRRLTFTGTSRLVIVPSQVRITALDLTNYWYRPEQPMFSVERLQYRNSDGVGEMHVGLGTAGAVMFDFLSCRLEQRLGRGHRVSDGWIYVDMATGDSFDFWNAFGQPSHSER